MEKEKPKYIYLLQTHYPRAKWTVNGREYEDIVWEDESPKPTKEYLDVLALKDSKIDERVEKKRQFLRKNVSEKESYLLLDADTESERALSSIEAIHAKHRKQIIDELLELKRLEVIKETSRQEIDYFEELSDMELAQKEDAVQYLKDTDWIVIREYETGKEVLESIKIKRQAARSIVEKGEKVYENWDSLQREELPPLEERIEAIKAGGERLKKIKAQVAAAQARYKKPRRR